MKKSFLAALCAAVLVTRMLYSEADALEAVLVPVEDGITLIDTSGSLYIHMQSEGALRVTVDKTEPEGIFRYYDAELANESESAEAQSDYIMNLSCCEYLVNTGEYASQYTVNISVPGYEKSVFCQNIVVKDPGFESVTGSEYHFYVTVNPSDSPGSQILNAYEYTSDEGILVSEQHIELLYQERLMGDVDGDGVVSISDATAVLAYYAAVSAGLEPDIDLDTADINGDGSVQISDATCILTYYALSAAGFEPVWDEIIGM